MRKTNVTDTFSSLILGDLITIIVSNFDKFLPLHSWIIVFNSGRIYLEKRTKETSILEEFFSKKFDL